MWVGQAISPASPLGGLESQAPAEFPGIEPRNLHAEPARLGSGLIAASPPIQHCPVTLTTARRSAAAAFGTILKFIAARATAKSSRTAILKGMIADGVTRAPTPLCVSVTRGGRSSLNPMAIGSGRDASCEGGEKKITAR